MTLNGGKQIMNGMKKVNYFWRQFFQRLNSIAYTCGAMTNTDVGASATTSKRKLPLTDHKLFSGIFVSGAVSDDSKLYSPSIVTLPPRYWEQKLNATRNTAKPIQGEIRNFTLLNAGDGLSGVLASMPAGSQKPITRNSWMWSGRYLSTLKGGWGVLALLTFPSSSESMSVSS